MWASRQIPPKDHASFIRDARDYALVNGIVLRCDPININCVAHLPFTLFPSPYPNELYQECLNIQPVVNRLMLGIANDTSFMNDTLRPIAQVDDFTKNLLDINDAVRREGLAQPIISCISRADYMLDTAPNAAQNEFRLRQVEVNAIASAMSPHSDQVAKLHDFLMTKYDVKMPAATISRPDNTSLATVVGGLVEAFDKYGKSSACILLVNEDLNRNLADQFKVELELTKMRPDIKFVRRPFLSLPDMIRLGPNKELLLEETREVAVVYFRYCYDPSHYSSSRAWDARLLMERSRAIKCPSINFHLAGAKKFQEVLNNQAKLERYLQPAEAQRLENVFCKFWSFKDCSDSDEGYKLATSESVGLVLKPQREGGGNNIYGRDIRPFVEKIAKTEAISQYILMEYIDAPLEKNWVVSQGDGSVSDSVRLDECDRLVSELGIYGAILADANTSLVESNKSGGYLVRSKRFGVNEGGVASGHAGISSLILVDGFQAADEFSLYYVKVVT